jgi:hypothetical protein
VDREEAERLLEVAREARWAFPTSFGRPVAEEPGEAVERLLDERGRLVEAARALPPEEAAELGARAWRVWVLARDEAGGRAFLAAALERGGSACDRALGLYGDNVLALRLGAVEESRELGEAALEAARACGDAEALALAHVGLARADFERGDYARARELAATARKHARDLELEVGRVPLHVEAQSIRMLGDLDRAAELLAESLALNRRVGDSGMVDVELHNLAHIELRRGNAARALALFAELGPPDALNAPFVAYAEGDSQRARELLDAAPPMTLPPDDRAELEWLRARLAA